MSLRVGQVAAVGLVGGAFVVAPGILPLFWLDLITLGLIFALAAASLDILVGYTGLVSLGHAAFFGLGGYGVGIAVIKLHWDPWPAAVFGVLAALVVGALFGAIGVRARGIYFLVITLAFGQVLWGVAVKLTDLTGGYNGIPGLVRPEVFGFRLDGVRNYYYAVVVIVGICLVFLHLFVRSPLGLSLQGIRSGEQRMTFLGYRTYGYKWLAFCVASLFGGVAGVLSAYYNQFVSPDNLYWTVSAQIMLMVILGSAGTVWGPAFVAVALTVVQTLISNVSDRWIMVLGLLYIGTVLLAPQGLLRLTAVGWTHVTSLSRRGSVGPRAKTEVTGPPKSKRRVGR